MPAFPRMFGAPELPPSDGPSNYVSIATVGQDASDPTRAFTFLDDSGQVLVEITLQPDGDKAQAFLCLEQTGPNAGGFVPVGFGDTVIVVFPNSDFECGYIVGRVADIEQRLAPTVAGIATTGTNGQVRQFRWVVTPRGQVYAISPSGELMLSGGSSGVQISGAQVLVDGATHLGAAFVTPPTPSEVAGGGQETPAAPAGPYVPPQGSTLTTPPFVGNAKAIVRVLDGVQSNPAIDPEFWAWKQALEVYLIAVDVFIQALATLNPGTIAVALGVYQTAVQVWNATPSPTAIESQHKGASTRHTALD